MAFVRYEKNQEIHDDFLFCQPLLGHTTGEDILNVMNKFMQDNKISWTKYVGISTDGAKSMVGINKGLIAKIQKVAPNVKSIHCCIHREALATRKMPADLQKVLDESVKIVNYIKGRPLNARLFAQMCEEMGSSHTQLLFHTDVTWLSRGKILSRLFELRQELQVFLNDKFELKKCLHDSTWLSKLAYLAEIFSILNGLNLSLQGKDISLFHVQDEVNATIEKLKLWKTRVNNGELDSSPSLHEFVIKSFDKIDTDVLKCLTEHLDGLQEGLKNYFPDLTTNLEWISHPFNIDSFATPDNLSNVEQEQLLELSADGFWKNKHKECSLAFFWLQMQQLYQNLTEKVLKHVLPFPTLYLYEVAFSALVDIKSKKRNRILDVEPHLRLKLTNREPDYNHLASSQHKQIHPSH
ncbi:zinc finger BED domain-containing protein 5-like [Onthophagus taurus]|uniref:zinc finger BED domain-containing protein 5-like n=1 Tax=Onthophagus taurus TaxID=166361 RepID=UPI0039BE779B